MIPDSPLSERSFSQADLERILAETFIDRVDYCPQVPSTNSRALQLAEETPDGSACLVLTDHQSAGRGRGGNSWWSTRGALTFSVLFRTPDFDLPVSRWPQLSLTVGLAVCEAIESLVPGATPALKWPNDVYILNRKLSGILVEAADGSRGSIVLGIGVNVNNSLELAPPEIRDKAIALCDATRVELRLVDVLVAVLERLAARMKWLAAGIDDLQETWSRRSLLTGKNVVIELPTRRIAGLCRGIDRDGALLVDTDSGLERCLAGVVVHFE
jgi:BirA family transcriptional regulator, biotin operon repressor / biotin---[acetyl-CoA-carboxylase] ligase